MACDDKLGSLMIIYSGYPYFHLPLYFCLLVFLCVVCRLTREEEKRRKERRLLVLGINFLVFLFFVFL
jgi:hypothetical protein